MRGRKKHPSNKEDNTQWVNTEKIEKQTSESFNSACIFLSIQMKTVLVHYS